MYKIQQFRMIDNTLHIFYWNTDYDGDEAWQCNESHRCFDWGDAFK